MAMINDIISKLAFKSGRSILSTVLSWFKQLLEDDKKQPRKESAVEEYYATGCFYLGEFLSKGVIEAGDQQLSATQDLLTESKSLLITCSSLFRSILSNANRSMSSAKRATLLELVSGLFDF